MSNEEHRQRHHELHESLDELVADWLAQTPHLMTTATVADLVKWSYSQTQNPTRNRFNAANHIPVIEVNRG
jgi:hypothetical protein